MKKRISLVLAVVMCLSLCACGQGDDCACDCPQCAQCERKTQDTTIATTNDPKDVAGVVEQNNNVIKFETPIVVAENEYLRVELAKFYEEYRIWKKGYPSTADETAEGATLEKIVTFKFYNKTDHTLSISMSEAYLGTEGANIFNIGSSSEYVAAGKSILKDFLIQTGEKETLESMEELYSLDGNFKASYVDDDWVTHLKGSDNLNFSIPNGMNGDGAAPISETANIYYGKWQVTDVKIAGENTSDEFTEEFLKGVLDVLDDTYFVFAESGECCYYSGSGVTVGKWTATPTGVTAGTNVFVAEGNQLILERDGFLLYWEKVSDSQEFPEE